MTATPSNSPLPLDDARDNPEFIEGLERGRTLFMSFEVSTQQFSGPLQLLLELIEKHDLPITDISLATVTEDYLRHLDENDVPTEELADFLVIASKLLLIKSKAILPVPVVEEEDGEDLAAQLKMYKVYLEATRHLEALYGSSPRSFARPRASVPARVEFLASKDLTSVALHGAFIGLLKRLEPFFTLQKASLERIVSVQERIVHIREAILERSRLAFSDVIRGAKSKVDVVVSFLALLELVKGKVVHAVQQDRFDDIMIKRVE